MFWTNYHSHTHFCDGSEKPDLYIKHAIKEGMPAYGYSSHAPVSFNTDWCIQDQKFDSYLREVSQIKEQYKDQIQTYLGLEVDFIPNVAGRSKHLLKGCQLDYFIGSIHFVDQFEDGTHWGIDTSKDLFDHGLRQIFNNDFRKAATRFYELTWQMLEEDKPDVIGHLDKIKMYNKNESYFKGNEFWYENLINKTLDYLKISNTIVEVNTRGYYRYGQSDLYPSEWIIEKIIQKNIPIMLNSDSHAPDELSMGYKYAAKELNKLGVKELWILYDGIWQPKAYTPEGMVFN